MDEGKSPKRVRRSFTDEFKAGAVRLVLDEGKTVCGVARDLDLTASTLRGWIASAVVRRHPFDVVVMGAPRDGPDRDEGALRRAWVRPQVHVGYRVPGWRRTESREVQRRRTLDHAVPQPRPERGRAGHGAILLARLPRHYGV